MTTDPTEILLAEHRVIRSALTVLVGMARRTERGRPPPGERARDLLIFLRRYADELHHEKEETVLFRALGEIGLPLGAGPLGALRHEHDVGRALLETLDESVGLGLDGAGGVSFAYTARRYVKVERLHSEREERQIFPLARNTLPEAMRCRIAESMQRHRVRHAAEQERCLALLEPLISMMGAP